MREYAREIGKTYRTVLNWVHTDALPQGVKAERLQTGTLLLHVQEHSVACPHCGKMIWKSQVGDAYGGL